MNTLIGYGYRTMITGLRIVEDASLVEVTEDWSRCRSRSRAERRRWQGHRQNVVITTTPKPDVYQAEDMLIMHPETRRMLDAELARRSQRFFEREVQRLLSEK